MSNSENRMTESQRLVNGGMEHQRAGRHKRAEQLYRRALELDFENADAWHLLGTLRLEAQDYAGGYAFTARALALSPDAVPCHKNIAVVLTSFGRFEEARRHLREAIRLNPTFGDAYFHLAEIVKFTPDDPLFETVGRLASNDKLSGQNRCFLNFAAGKMYDDIDQPDRAFLHYAAGNRLAGRRYDWQEHDCFTEASIAAYDAELFGRLGKAGLPIETPTFIVGMPRSGTSLAEQVLASHSRVRGAGELWDIAQIIGALPEQLPEAGPYPDCLAALTPKVLQGFARGYATHLRELVGNPRRAIDKQPLNFRRLGLIALLFPRARILHVRRDPLDTCLSCFFQNFSRGQDYSFDLGDLGRFYRDYDRLMAHWDEVLPGRIKTVRYEDLVGNLGATARDLVAHCGLEWEDDCLDFRRSGREVRTASKWQVRQPIYPSSVGRWRKYRRHLGPLIEALGPFAGEATSTTSA